MANNYYELRLEINPDMEDIIAEIFFDNFDCDGVILAEESYKDLEMTSTTQGTLKVFLISSKIFMPSSRPGPLNEKIDDLLALSKLALNTYGIFSFSVT